MMPPWVRLALAVVVSLAFVPSLAPGASAGGFAGLADFCIYYGVGADPDIANRTSLTIDVVSLDVTPVMKGVHMSPFVAGVEIHGVFGADAVVVMGLSSSKSYKVAGGVIRLDPFDLDVITGLTDPLVVSLIGAVRVERVCLDYYDVSVLVRRGEAPVGGALVVLSPLNGTHGSSYYITGSSGRAVVNFRPDLTYRLTVTADGSNVSRILLLGKNHNGAQVTVDLLRGVVLIGDEQVAPEERAEGSSPLWVYATAAIAIAIVVIVAVSLRRGIARVPVPSRWLSRRPREG